MTAQQLITNIRDALGNPTNGPIAEALPLIEHVITTTLGDTTTRTLHPTETR